MVGRRGDTLSLIHLIPRKTATGLNVFESFCQILVVTASPAAGSRRNGRAVGAGARVTEERADFIGGLGRENVFELAGLLLDFRFAVHGQAVGEKPLRQTMTANDAAGALAAACGQFDNRRAVAHRCRYRL